MIKQEIQKQIKGQVSDNPADIKKYSQDASLFEITPELIVFPKDAEDIKHLVKYVSEHKKENPHLSLTVRSGGTDMSGGSINDSIIIDVNKHINKIGHVKDKNIITEPGAFYRNFEPVTLKEKLIMPSYPASKHIATVGGMVANNSGGEKSLVYGQTKDYVKALQVILADGKEYTFSPLTKKELDLKMQRNDFEGKIYKETYKLIDENYDLIQAAKPTTSKNSSGYFLWDVWDKEEQIFDLTQLFTGSQGTLGIITNIKFRLMHLPPKSKLLVMFLEDTKMLGDLVRFVMQHKPESFESYDKHTFKLAIKYLPGMIKMMKGNIFKLGLQFLPELWMVITGGVPNLVLIAEFTSESETELEKKLEKISEDVKNKFDIKTYVTKSQGESEKYWTIRRESFNLLRKHAGSLKAAPFVDDIIVHPDQLPKFLPELNAIFDRYPELIYTIAGHAGDANFHIIPLMNLKNAQDRAVISQISHLVYDLVLKYDGSITAEHNDGLIRTPYLEKMYGPEMVQIFKQIKKIFDPLNIFNPKKKVGGTEDYALRHIKH